MRSMDTAAELNHLLGPLRRAVLRSVRSAEDLPDLPEAQIELLRVLASASNGDGISPRAAATRLKVAPSTVSNLVRAMTASGLVERHPVPGNNRTVLLAPSPRALDLLSRYDHAGAATLTAALDRLPAPDRDRLHATLPVLARLVAELEHHP
ncbi:MarR family winged helix-turn-helix transcriptional regulator [Streptomyces sp. NPDC059373]